MMRKGKKKDDALGREKQENGNEEKKRKKERKRKKMTRNGGEADKRLFINKANKAGTLLLRLVRTAFVSLLVLLCLPG